MAETVFQMHVTPDQISTKLTNDLEGYVTDRLIRMVCSKLGYTNTKFDSSETEEDEAEKISAQNSSAFSKFEFNKSGPILAKMMLKQIKEITGAL